MRVVICGGRDYGADMLERVNIECAMSAYVRDGDEIAHGGASGVDTIAGEEATRRGLSVRVYKAQWSKYGASAGPKRNAEMLRDFKPDLVLAFPGGRGTADMVRRARFAGVRVVDTGAKDR